MKNLTITLLLLFSTLHTFSQERGGTLELGVRNTLSLFENDGHTGIGLGMNYLLLKNVYASL